MHVTCICFFFSKAVLHNILKLLSLGQLLQQFILNTTTVHTGTPRKSEQSALQRRQLDLGDRFNRSPFLMEEGWGRTEASFKKRINKKKKKEKKSGWTIRRNKFKMWQEEQQKGNRKKHEDHPYSLPLTP